MGPIDRYFELVKQFPHLFRDDKDLHIIKDQKFLENYAGRTGEKVGVIYESSFHLFVVDLIQNRSGEFYTYARILNPNTKNGVVVIPYKDGKFALLKQFRHGTRDLELEFPRGFSEPGISPEENAKKELYEEIGARALRVNNEGSLISDTGLTGGEVDIFYMEIDKIRHFSADEGVKDLLWVGLEEMMALIRNNTIRDAYTISAISKYLINRGEQGPYV